MAAEQKNSAAEVSKTAMLRGVMKDVATLRTDLAASLQTIEAISTWAKSTVKPGMQQLQGTPWLKRDFRHAECTPNSNSFLLSRLFKQ